MSSEPGDRMIAPGSLGLVQSFVNSVNLEFGPDRFESVEGLNAWISRRRVVGGVIGAGVAADEVDRRNAVLLREALRELLRENNGAEPDPSARRTVDRIARDCPLVVAFGSKQVSAVLRPTQPDARGVLAEVLAAAAAAMADGSWSRLKACGEHRCEWAFFDRSRNRSGRWCSMAVCGARSKMQVYRQQLRQSEPVR